MSNWATKAAKSAPSLNLDPLIGLMPLYPWQARYLRDQARLKGLLKARQVGGSTIATLDMVLDVMLKQNDWNTMSRTGRQAKKLLRKAAVHVNALDFVIRNKFGKSKVFEKITSEEIVLTNGRQMTALPCDPDTTVGDTVSWLLDEAALYPNSETIFGTIKPSIMRGKRMQLLSTPRGRQGMFPETYRKWKEDPSRSGWSFHAITIEQAMQEGLVLSDHKGRHVSFDEFKAQEVHDIGREMWLQEYMCAFQDLVNAFLDSSVTERCFIKGQDLVKSPTQMNQLDPNRSVFMGLDIGRFKDLTVLWIVSVGLDGFYKTEAVICCENTTTDAQLALIRPYLDSGRCVRCCVDYLGVGIGVFDGLMLSHPHIVEKVAFTNALKHQIAQRIKVEMEGHNWSMPDSDDIAEDFDSIQRVTTPQGNVRLEATPGGRTHGDYFWSASLALHGATQYGPGKIVMSAA